MIASPVVTRDLAELGASVMRVTGPHVADLAPLCAEVNWGKWNAHIDLRTDEGKMKLRELVEEADVVVDGYRPGVMDKYGFGKQGILDITKERKKGIIYLRENCYVSGVDYREAVGILIMYVSRAGMVPGHTVQGGRVSANL